MTRTILRAEAVDFVAPAPGPSDQAGKPLYV